jgi:glycosyltransferase involved in cell wall biosynthesis
MLVSVVIPAYNASRFIAATLESVLAQTFPPAEIIVIDDGSTDSTAEIAESFGPPVRVIRRNNSGQAASRNFAVQQASCEWIAFIDADDLWDPCKLEKQKMALAETPGAELCYTARVCFEQTGHDCIRPTLTIPVPPARQIRKALSRSTTFLPSSVVIRRSVFLDAGGFNSHYKIVEDWDLWLRLLSAGVVFTACTEPLLLYRTHEASISRRADVALAECIEIYRNHVYPRLPLATRWFRFNRVRSQHEAVAAMVLRSNNDPRSLSIMLSSILRDPVHYPHRYKVLAHMLYTQAKSLGASFRRTGNETDFLA